MEYHEEGIIRQAEDSATTAGATAPLADKPLSPTDEGKRLSRLLWVFAFLLFAFLVPSVVGRIQYEYKYNSERAEVDAALEGLEKTDLTDLSLAFRKVAQGVGPSVVHIRVARVVRNALPSDERKHFFGNPRPFATQSQGSGIIVDDGGYVVTNNHVVQGAASITVQLNDGRETDADVVGDDPLTDIAVLKINLPNLIARDWGDSDALDVGSMVWAVGSPFGLQRTVTFGIISAKNRRGVTRNFIQEFLQSDAAVNPGNSGGPLVNIKGKIIGINTAIVGQSYQGISFAIPSNTARKVYEQIRRDGKVSRGWLGVKLDTVSPDLARRLQLDESSGVLIRDVSPDSPADRAGILPGDVIVRWNDTKTTDAMTLSRLVAATEIGTKATVEVIRSGAHKQLSVVVTEIPDRIRWNRQPLRQN